MYHDVTERVRREAVLETLHDRTWAMMTAETRREVCEIAVETAREALGMDINGIWLFDEGNDEEEPALRPAASSQQAQELFETIPTYRPGNSLSWAVFSAGETRVYRDIDGEDAYNDDTPIRSEIVVPLGDQGVMNVGATVEDAFGESALSLAELLATNTEAALERAERERLLRNRERVLEQQNERLDEFASIVSHDLRNPLTSAEIALDLAASDCESEFHDNIGKSLERMDTLVEEALTLARQGLLVSDPEPVDMDAVVESARETLGRPRRSWSSKRISRTSRPTRSDSERCSRTPFGTRSITRART
ncbi:hypothetical protein BRC86_03125 [Halobacteriales archaeon QS_3_64_16]|nr:MAG: hypothetical protein BRC86_03125 [Halobacteriales archaeon QS_3_64_16]